MRLVPFRSQHADRMILAEREAAARSLWRDPAIPLRLYGEGGFALSAVAEGRIVAAGGLLVLRPGVAEAWLLRSVEMPRHGIALARSVAREIGAAAATLDLHRVQATVPLDDPRARRFAEWLGFVPEGVMRRYGADTSDHILYAKV